MCCLMCNDIAHNETIVPLIQPIVKYVGWAARSLFIDSEWSRLGMQQPPAMPPRKTGTKKPLFAEQVCSANRGSAGFSSPNRPPLGDQRFKLLALYRFDFNETLGNGIQFLAVGAQD